MILIPFLLFFSVSLAYRGSLLWTVADKVFIQNLKSVSMTFKARLNMNLSENLRKFKEGFKGEKRV